MVRNKNAGGKEIDHRTGNPSYEGIRKKFEERAMKFAEDIEGRSQKLEIVRGRTISFL